MSPSIICLVETKSNPTKTLSFCKLFHKNWDWAVAIATGYSSGIINLWKRKIGLVTPILGIKTSIHLVISSLVSASSVLSIVYNSQRLSDQNLLQNSLSSLTSLNLPWLLAGDFNEILSANEHKGGNCRSYSSKAKIFYNFILQNNLLDLGFSGSNFTWCNGHSRSSRRWARLDHFLANLNWIFGFNSYVNLHIPHIVSGKMTLCPLFSSIQLLKPHCYTKSCSFSYTCSWL